MENIWQVGVARVMLMESSILLEIILMVLSPLTSKEMFSSQIMGMIVSKSSTVKASILPNGIRMEMEIASLSVRLE